jgi:hypothetical protein
MDKAKHIAEFKEGHMVSMDSSVQLTTNGVNIMGWIKTALINTEEAIFKASEQLTEAAEILNAVGIPALAVKLEMMAKELNDVDIYNVKEEVKND